ncbi:hypothetical protein DL770_002512 [Monosporascus sp. CRB-9-2]|nr:hypothetical protein DL770_002512 [Monosporascus sp. CRB-9-2]
MGGPQSLNQEPQIRLFVACPRSGSTLLMRIFAESPLCVVTSRLVLMGNTGSGGVFAPDYSILENPSRHNISISAMNSGKRLIICKEELGNNTLKGECLYDTLPSLSAYAMARPVFLIRDAIRVFDSWKNVGWMDIQNLLDCYVNMFQMLHRFPSYATSCLLYERLIRDPQTEIKHVCARWGVPFLETMLDFKQPFGSSFVFPTDKERALYCEGKPLGLFTTVEATSSVEVDVPYHGLLSNAEKEKIEEHVGQLYIRCWNDDVLRLQAILKERPWFGFDLDDTLHEFRRSSGIATDKTLEEISKRYGTPLPALRDEYSRILREKTANAFSDGKTSFDYRRERFSSVLAHFSLPQDQQIMTQLLELYEVTLMASLELKCGALQLLSAVKDMGKKIVIMTEGPQDAQERTVQGLGIGGYIDFLATTNHFRVTKTNGLYPRVLEHLGISPGDIAYVGDNEQRDMKPAMAEGIFSIHLAETKHVSLNSIPPQVNTLSKLRHILSYNNP